MDNDSENFEQLRKLLKLKRHEQPPPGYFNRFSGLVISRIERQNEADSVWAEAHWLRKLLRIFESSPVVGGLFGAGLCALVVFGVTMANQAEKVPAIAFSPVVNTASEANKGDTLALNPRLQVSGRSTDAMFGSNMLGGNGSVTAQLEPVTFSTSH